MTLVCSGISKSFGGVHALTKVDLQLDPGDIIGLIGPNGSGKSTLVNVISGFIDADEGEIILDGEDIGGRSPMQVRQRGLARTFQNLRLCSPLTVLENMLIGLHLRYAESSRWYWQWIPSTFGGSRTRTVEAENYELAVEALRRVGLHDKAEARVQDLSYGEQKRLELARATVLPTRALLLDEPTAGLAPDEAALLMEIVAKPIVGSSERSLLLIEHRLDLVLDVCTSVIVLDSGEVIARGTPKDVAADPEVRRVYIGGTR